MHALLLIHESGTHHLTICSLNPAIRPASEHATLQYATYKVTIYKDVQVC